MASDPAASTVTLVVAVAGFVVVAQWWLARRFASGTELDPADGLDEG
jgi:high-affinity Fe2+/Pb2+ permease